MEEEVSPLRVVAVQTTLEVGVAWLEMEEVAVGPGISDEHLSQDRDLASGEESGYPSQLWHLLLS